jgi:hypothetical protein
MRMKYAICPGWITSRNDGNRHFIGFANLVKLYGVDLAECVLVTDGQRTGWSEEELSGLTWLHPQSSELKYEKIRERLAQAGEVPGT